MNKVGAPELGGRFTCLRRIGEGGFGVVYEAVDRQFGSRVALKVLRPERAAAAARFKREFRSLVDIQHENLVKLFELAAEGEHLYFSMELVEGVDFLAHVGAERALEVATAEWPVRARERRNVCVSAEPLRGALVQLVMAVQALHDARRLHCDVKPTNVLVDCDGRVVLLDFGLITNIDDATPSTLGTPGYMAPEQVAGGVLTEATDWYGVGAILHEAITGAVPRAGWPCETGNDELRPFADLCTALLDPVAANRPSGNEVLERLGASRSRAPRPRSKLFGRDTELARLRAAWGELQQVGGTRVVRIVGGSGIGKTALVEHLLQELRERGAWVLASRCYEQESVPYKAIDGAIDMLGDLLAREPAARSRIPVGAGVLARLFPVLRPIVDDDDRSDHEESQTARRRAFQRLRELLTALAAEHPIALFIDDAQWGDVDSARMLAALVQPPDEPRMLVVVTHRPDPMEHGFLAALDEQPLGVPDERIDLTELAPADVRSLAEHLVGAHASVISHIEREAAGNPLFIQQLAAALHDGDGEHALALGDLVQGRVEALGEGARRLVQTVALAAGPIDERIAVAAADVDATAVRGVTVAVRHARLVTARAAAHGVLLEPSHDRVREAIVATLPEAVARTQHLRIADTLLTHGHPDPDALVHHLRRGGDLPRARAQALLAADRAESSLAFDRAAMHLQFVLEGDHEDRARLHERHGNALANAGRGAEAAESFERAADASTAEPERELDLRRRAGELTLRSGRIELGMERMDRVLRSVGVRMPRWRATAGIVGMGRRLRVFARGLAPRVRAATVSSAATSRLQALWSASTGLSMVNHVVADALGLQHLLEAMAVGDRSHLIRGLGYEAAFEAVIGGRFLRKRCARILAAMDELASASADPYDAAWAQMSKGVTSWFLGDWTASWKNCDEAAAIYREHCRGVAWELAICDAYRLPALTYLGELQALGRVVPIAYTGARERGDLFAVNLLRLGQQSMTFLAEDRPDTAIEEANAAIAPFPPSPFLLPHYHHVFATAQAELYRGRAAAAWDAIEAAWRGLEQARLVMVQCLRCEIRHLRARAALALAPGHRDEARLRTTARRAADVIARDDVAPAAGFAAVIRAALARNDDERQRQLTAALIAFEAAHMQLYAHACRDRLGALVGGSAGRDQRDVAAAWFASQLVRDPARMIAMLVPGV